MRSFSASIPTVRMGGIVVASQNASVKCRLTYAISHKRQDKKNSLFVNNHTKPSALYKSSKIFQRNYISVKKNNKWLPKFSLNIPSGSIPRSSKKLRKKIILHKNSQSH